MSAPFDPVYSHNGQFDDYWNTKPVKGYYRLLGNMLRQDPAEHMYRQRAYEDLGQQTMAATQGAQMGATSAFGFNNPSGITSSLMQRAYMSAPYGSADMAAEEAGRQSTIGTGNALMDAKQRHANWYASLKNIRLSYEQMKIQEEVAKAQAAASAAAASGG